MADREADARRQERLSRAASEMATRAKGSRKATQRPKASPDTCRLSTQGCVRLKEQHAVGSGAGQDNSTAVWRCHIGSSLGAPTVFDPTAPASFPEVAPRSHNVHVFASPSFSIACPRKVTHVDVGRLPSGCRRRLNSKLQQLHESSPRTPQADTFHPLTKLPVSAAGASGCKYTYDAQARLR